MSNDKKMLSSIGYYYSSVYLSNYSYINLQAILYISYIVAYNIG